MMSDESPGPTGIDNSKKLNQTIGSRDGNKLQ
jgi:hypothetical protein